MYGQSSLQDCLVLVTGLESSSPNKSSVTGDLVGVQKFLVALVTVSEKLLVPHLSNHSKEVWLQTAEI